MNDFNDFNNPNNFNRRRRVEMLNSLVEYYTVHLDSIRRVQSIKILQEVF